MEALIVSAGRSARQRTTLDSGTSIRHAASEPAAAPLEPIACTPLRRKSAAAAGDGIKA